jgi:hypothetical protein
MLAHVGVLIVIEIRKDFVKWSTYILKNKPVFVTLGALAVNVPETIFRSWQTLMYLKAFFFLSSLILWVSPTESKSVIIHKFIFLTLSREHSE